MEQIHIQCKRSECKVYHEYCEKYYQAQDTSRKQSVYACIELFLKGILPVGNQDITAARKVLLGKCDLLKKEHYSSAEGDPGKLAHIRVCTDILQFLDDLEKMYRLLQKEGIAADYLMLLGSFSRIIEESRTMSRPDTFTLKPDVIDALALPLAAIIRSKLGSDKRRESVIREFAQVAARYNLQSAEVKFDLEILRLVAPGVMSFFDRNARPEDYLPALTTNFIDSELQEFATFLDQRAETGDTAQQAKIKWETITQPLKAVATEMAIQREERALVTPKTEDPFSLAPVSGLFAEPPAKDFRTFNIVVIPDGTELVEASPQNMVITPQVRVISGPSFGARSGIRRPAILVIGIVAVIIAFIVGTMILGGSAGTGNTTSPAVTVTPTLTAAPVTTTIPVTTTVAVTTEIPTTKPTTTTTTPVPRPVTTRMGYSSADIGNHLVDVAFGPDNDVITKPTKDLVEISFFGLYNKEDLALLDTLITKFNIFSSTTKISTNPILNSEADVILEFLPQYSMTQVNKNKNATSSYRDPQTGDYYFIHTKERTYVNAELKGDERSRWVYRALLFNFGLVGETGRYPQSIFYGGTTNVTQLADIDWKAVQLMYGKKVLNGMTSEEVRDTY